MAFSLDGVIAENEIRDLFIPQLESSLVSSMFLTQETVIDAASISIPGIDDFGTEAYTGGALNITPVTDNSKTLVLDRSEYFAKTIDKVDNAQSAVKIIGKALDIGVVAAQTTIDVANFALLATTTNKLAAVTVDETNIVQVITDLNTELSILKAPKKGRRLALDPRLSGILSKANLTYNTSTAELAAREGFIGRFGGFDIFETNNLAAGASTGKMIIASVPDCGYSGLGFQEYNVTAPTTLFTWLIKGLVNFGGVIVRDEFVVAVDATVA